MQYHILQGWAITIVIIIIANINLNINCDMNILEGQGRAVKWGGGQE
jgi:hypothetical protein